MTKRIRHNLNEMLNELENKVYDWEQHGEWTAAEIEAATEKTLNKIWKLQRKGKITVSEAQEASDKVYDIGLWYN